LLGKPDLLCLLIGGSVKLAFVTSLEGGHKEKAYRDTHERALRRGAR